MNAGSPRARRPHHVCRRAGAALGRRRVADVLRGRGQFDAIRWRPASLNAKVGSNFKHVAHAQQLHAVHPGMPDDEHSVLVCHFAHSLNLGSES